LEEKTQVMTYLFMVAGIWGHVSRVMAAIRSSIPRCQVDDETAESTTMLHKDNEKGLRLVCTVGAMFCHMITYSLAAHILIEIL
jgi:CO dehydrogenase/acetyl-CoA synthase alpha subunit